MSLLLQPSYANNPNTPSETEAEREERKAKEAEALADMTDDIMAGDLVGRHSMVDVVDTLDSETLALWLLKLHDADDGGMKALLQDCRDLYVHGCRSGSAYEHGDSLTVADCDKEAREIHKRIDAALSPNDKDLWRVRRDILDEVEERVKLYLQPLDQLIADRVADE